MKPIGIFRFEAFRLMRLAAASTTLAAAAATLLQAERSAVGRLRDTGWLWLAQRLGKVFNFELTSRLPEFAQPAWELHEWAVRCEFFLAASLISALPAIAIGGVVAFGLQFLSRRSGESLWWRGYFKDCAAPAALIAVCWAPEILHEAELHGSASAAGGWGLKIVSLAIAATCAVAMVAGRPRWIAAATRAASWAAVVLVCFAASYWAVSPATAEARAPYPATAQHPNILLISIDSLRADHLGSYGYQRPTSPTIDRLAGEGVRFETALAPTSWTLPSHITLLTGLDPRAHGVRLPGDKLGRAAWTVTEALHGRVYATAGFVSGPFLQASFGYLQGFDHYDDYSAVRLDRDHSSRTVTSPLVLEKNISWLERWNQASDRPFFIFLHLWDVHYDYLPPEPHRSRFARNPSSPMHGANVFFSPLIHRGMAGEELDELIALYDAEIRFTDEHIGRLLETLESLGVLDETIIVVTADHGEEFFEHGRKTHGKSLYEEVLRVPLIVRYPPRVPAGRVVPSVVRLMDIAPTLMELAGIPAIERRSGEEGSGSGVARSLVSLIETTRREPPRSASGDLRGNLRSFRVGRYKLISSRASGEELYDLADDPGETANLAADHPELVGTLRAAARQWDAEVSRRESDADSSVLDAEQLEALRSLGYIQ